MSDENMQKTGIPTSTWVVALILFVTGIGANMLTVYIVNPGAYWDRFDRLPWGTVGDTMGGAGELFIGIAALAALFVYRHAKYTLEELRREYDSVEDERNCLEQEVKVLEAARKFAGKPELQKIDKRVIGWFASEEGIVCDPANRKTVVPIIAKALGLTDSEIEESLNRVVSDNRN